MKTYIDIPFNFTLFVEDLIYPACQFFSDGTTLKLQRITNKFVCNALRRLKTPNGNLYRYTLLFTNFCKDLIYPACTFSCSGITLKSHSNAPGKMPNDKPIKISILFYTVLFYVFYTTCQVLSYTYSLPGDIWCKIFPQSLRITYKCVANALSLMELTYIYPSLYTVVKDLIGVSLPTCKT